MISIDYCGIQRQLAAGMYGVAKRHEFDLQELLDNLKFIAGGNYMPLFCLELKIRVDFVGGIVIDKKSTHKRET